jgi:hypothetical protein
MSCLSFASARARLGGVICSEKTSESIWLLARHTFKLRECIPGTGYRVADGLLQSGVLCLCSFLTYDPACFSGGESLMFASGSAALGQPNLGRLNRKVD